MVDFDNVSTKVLVEELKKREGVKIRIAEPYQTLHEAIEGSAIILIIID